MNDFENEFQNTNIKTDPLQCESWPEQKRIFMHVQPTSRQAAEMLHAGLNPDAGAALARLATRGALQNRESIWSNIPAAAGTARSMGIEAGN